jgi:hypothetical protein
MKHQRWVYVLLTKTRAANIWTGGDRWKKRKKRTKGKWIASLGILAEAQKTRKSVDEYKSHLAIVVAVGGWSLGAWSLHAWALWGGRCGRNEQNR